MKKANDLVIAGGVAYRAHERCWPAGVPTFDHDVVGAPLFIYQLPNEIVVVMASGPEVRHIYLNQPHSANPKPSWYGESVGKYEGDTLVVDTIGLNSKTFVDNFRTPHSEKLHVVERFRMVDDGKALELRITVEDPQAYKQPWQAMRKFNRVQSTLNEEICREGNFVLFDYGIPIDNTSDF